MQNNILIITHSSETGINQLQSTECANVIGFTNHNIKRILNPEDVTKQDIEENDRIIMIVPEWNSSFPWTFKKMIDDSGYPSYFEDKNIFLVGTSNTTFGNIVGINHLANILEWVGARVVERVCVPHIQDKFANNDIQVDERLNNAVIAFANC
jgi:NAD(P)H-dependent FMN reductase